MSLLALYALLPYLGVGTLGLIAAKEPSQPPEPPQPPMTPTTTAQEDLTTAGQRKVNLIWEYTQSVIALMIVLSCVIVASVLAIKGKSNDFPVILTSLVMLVIGFYFSRTNHAAIGGVGQKPNEEYKGR